MEKFELNLNGANGDTSNTNFGFGTTTSGTYNITNTKKVCEVKIVENEEGNFIEVISRLEGLSLYVNSSTHYTKERYGVVDGKIALIKIISGTEKPARWVQPGIEWAE